MSKRRRLLAALGVITLVPRAVLAQTKQPVLIAWLNSDSRELSGANLVAFKEALAALGWKEGAQYVLEERWANGRMDVLQSMAKELSAKKPAIIVGALGIAVHAAAKAAPKTPIVMVTGADPIAEGLVKTLARPGGLITGLTTVSANTSEKHLELLLAAAPTVKRVGVLGSPSPVVASATDAIRRAAGRFRVEVRAAEATTAEEIEPALSRLAKEGAQALIIAGGSLLRNERRRIVTLAMAQRWPVVGGQGGWADAGALISYSADRLANYRQAAHFVDRILKGANPGDLPVEQPTRFETVINRRTAKALNLTIPQQLLLQADRVIE